MPSLPSFRSTMREDLLWLAVLRAGLRGGLIGPGVLILGLPGSVKFGLAPLVASFDAIRGYPTMG